jgi:hypothetical protein
LVEQLGVQARERASNFSWERTVSEYEGLFLDLVAARGPSPVLADGNDSNAPPSHLSVAQVGRSPERQQAEATAPTTDDETPRVA